MVIYVASPSADAEIIKPMPQPQPPNIGEIFEANCERIRGFVYSKVGHAAHAQDITQDVFIVAMLKLPKFVWPTGHMDDIVSWLYKVAEIKCREHHRKSYHRPEDSLDGMEEDERGRIEAKLFEQAQLDESDNLGTQETLAKDIEKLVSVMAAKLTDDERAVIVAKHFSNDMDWNSKVYARENGLRDGTVRQWLARGLAKLRKYSLQHKEGRS